MRTRAFALMLVPLALVVPASAASLFPPLFDLSSLDGTSGFVIHGVDDDDQIGLRVSASADINDDGVADLLISSRHSLACYVVFGGSGLGATGSFDLASLDGTNGFVLTGVSAIEQARHYLSRAGDVNADGIDDILIGDKYAEPNGETFAGATYVVFGAQNVGSSGVVDLPSLDGTDGFAISGESANQTGQVVSDAGDLNNDGYDDVIIGTDRAWSKRGEAYVVFGGPGVGSSGEILLSSLNGTNGFVVPGPSGSGHFGLGSNVANTGDLNGDEIDDVIIGRFDYDHNPPIPAECFVVFGGTNIGASGLVDVTALDGSDGYFVQGNQESYFGMFVTSAGDFNNDALPDFVVSTYVIFGSASLGATGSFDVSAIDGSNGFAVGGGQAPGDVNGDGVDDLLFPESTWLRPGVGVDTGRCFVLFGGAGVGAQGSFDLDTLLPSNGGNGSQGFEIRGTDSGDRAGTSVASADVNDDGISDIIIGATGGDPGGIADAGEVYVIFGRAVPPPVCQGDLDASGTTDVFDFAIFAPSFGANIGDPNYNPDADFDHNDSIDVFDFGTFATDFGCPD